ncbi:hypothetical protein I4U23_012465 [Adineta vaga]|nr:hypothetical protein I4U23_012465 [Adineta vaga]
MASRWFILLASLAFVQLGTSNPVPSSKNGDASPYKTINTNDNYYLNAFFGMTIEKPDGWLEIDSEHLHSLLQTAVNEVTSKIKQISTESVENVSLIPLIGFTKYPLGTENGQTNANIIGVAEKITDEKIVGKDCDVFNAQALITSANNAIVSRGDCVEYTANGLVYAAQESLHNLGNSMILKQTQLIRSAPNGYRFTFSLTYSNNNDKDVLFNCMNNVVFSK